MTRKNLAIVAAISVILFAGAVFVGEAAFAKKKLRAKITYLEGKAFKAKKKRGPWKPLRKGSKLSKKDYLKTDKDSRVEITLPDGSKLRVAENSLIKMKSLLSGAGSKKKINIELKSGKVWATVKKALGGEQKFEIKTENAVAGVRGTIFRVDYHKDAVTVVKVYAGAVAVRNIPVYAKPQDMKSGKRVQVSGPKQISKQKWEELIAKEMQMIKVLADGSMSPPEDFDLTSEEEDKWAQWNREMDKKEDLMKEHMEK